MRQLAILSVLVLALFCLTAARNTSSPLNIHLISHSHDDIGWLKTVDEYFYGLRNDIQNAGVQYILDSVVRALHKNPERRFIYVEIGFFYRWWKNADDLMKKITFKLVQNGQLEFINGGWCMHDEANPYYEDMIGNMAVGHEFLKNTFNVTPTIGWQIDPFGHSNTNPSFYSQMGFNGLWFGRIDFQDFKLRLETKNMEMVWNPTTSQGAENQIFTGVLYPSLYVWPNDSPYGNFGYDLNWWPPADPVVDDEALEGYNIESVSTNFVNYFRNMATHYKTSNVMKTLGMDFEYQAAHIDFKNVDKLVNFISSRKDLFPNVTIQYSTPSIYLKAVHDSAQNVEFQSKTDDFFPYADGDNAFWTGYFTSRVAVKGNVRRTGRYLQNVKRLVAYKFWEGNSAYLAKQEKTVTDALRQLEQTMGVLQHHDAVAGTEKQRVADDYIYLLDRDLMRVHREVLNPIMKETAHRDIGYNGDFQLCEVNVTASLCNATAVLANNTPVVVGVFNPLETTTTLIRIKVTTGNLTVNDAAGNAILADVICANQSDVTDCDLFFSSRLQGFTQTFFYLVPSTISIAVQSKVTVQPRSLFQRYQVGENQYLTVFEDLTNFEWQDNEDISAFSLQFNYYPSFCANDSQNSGAYIFRPAASNLGKSSPYSAPKYSFIFQGKVVTQITTQYAKTIANMRFTNPRSTNIELETFVDSIDIRDRVGKEIVLLLRSGIENNKTFYTDSNGQEMQQRILNHRQTWNFTTVQPAAGNYYPINAAIYIENPKTKDRITLLTDRTHGGSSLHPGEIELMLNRRTICDDGRGVEEPLMETDPITGLGLKQWFKHNLIFTPGASASSQRALQFTNDQPVLVAVSPLTNSSIRSLRSPKFFAQNPVFSSKKDFALPQSVKTLIRTDNKNTYVIWFHHLSESTTAKITNHFFVKAFARAKSYNLTELNLSANQLKTEALAQRFSWKTSGKTEFSHFANKDYLEERVIKLRPLEIRTFRVDVQW